MTDTTDHPYNWDELDEIRQQMREAEAAQHRRATAYHHIFAQDPLGQKILAEWVNDYCTGHPPSPNASEREVGMMDGKRQLVKLILDQITIVTGETKDD